MKEATDRITTRVTTEKSELSEEANQEGQDRFMLTHRIIPTRYKKARFLKIQGEAVAVDMAKDCVKDGKTSLFITGKSGCGKTMLAAATAMAWAFKNAAITYDKPPIWVNVNEFCFEMREAIKEGRESDVMNHYARTPLLIFDDIGVQQDTDYSLSNIYLLLNRRWESEKVSIITSNDTLEVIGQKMGVRVADRILRSCEIVKMEQGSFALRKGKK